MTNEELATAVVNELTLAYMQAGSHISADNALNVAKSLCESIDFKSVEEVKAAFRRAKMVTDIPTQRTLAEALKNHRAETAPSASTAPAIEYRNPLEQWLPTEEIRKCINLCTAMRNYCAAVSDDLYLEYCRVHAKIRDEAGHVKFVNPNKAYTFDKPIKDTLRNLYRKYWRKCACAAGYPAEAPYNLGLVPPTVPEFRAMLYYENQQQRA